MNVINDYLEMTQALKKVPGKNGKPKRATSSDIVSPRWDVVTPESRKQTSNSPDPVSLITKLVKIRGSFVYFVGGSRS
jgi:hypothetical protein